jgi:WD40 repeat protein
MRLLPRTSRGTVLLATVVGLAGVAALGFGLPTRPRVAWTPPEQAELVGFLPDGRTVVTLDHRPPAHDLTGPLRLWDAVTGTQTAAHPLPARQIRYPTLAPDGRWLAWVDEGDNHLHVVEVGTGQEVFKYPREERSFMDGGVRFSPDGRLLALDVTESPEQRVRLWDVGTWRSRATLEDAGQPLAFSPDGRLLAAVQLKVAPGGKSLASVLHVWDVSDPDAPAERFHDDLPGAPRRPTFSPDGRFLVTGVMAIERGADDAVMWWDVAAGRRLHQLSPASDADFVADGTGLVAVIHWQEEFRTPHYLALWDVDPPRERRSVLTVPGRCVVGGDVVAVMDLRDNVWDYPGGLFDRLRWPWPFRRGAQPVLTLYDLDGRELGRVPGGVRQARFAPDGRTLVVMDNGRLALWDVPPRHPWGWFVGLSAAWALAIAALTRWRVRNASAKRR